MTASGLADEVHKAPTCEASRRRKRALLVDQMQEITARGTITVTCPCGQRVPVIMAERCYDCGLWFCRRCARRHFGREPNRGGR